MARLRFAFLLIAGTNCRDLSSFTTVGGHYEGPVVQGQFVRAGVDPAAKACLTIDTEHIEDSPGAISTSDGRFRAVALRPIPQLWHDPLSTLSFGEGRLRNLLYVATPSQPFDGRNDDVFVVISLMQAGDVEVRLLRGAPSLPGDGGTAASAGGNLFAVFDLLRGSGRCSY